MSRCDGLVHMRIEDDGVGLPQTCNSHQGNTYTSPVGHYGLNGMAERVQRIGGTLSLKPGAARGTLVEVELPFVGVQAQSVMVQ